MTEITQERYNALKEVLRRMEENDYKEVEFADEDELVRLLVARKNWYKELKTGDVYIDFKGSDEEWQEHIAECKKIDAHNARIQSTYIKPIEAQIQMLEVELMLYNGIFQMRDTSEGIHERVYPPKKEDYE